MHIQERFLVLQESENDTTYFENMYGFRLPYTHKLFCMHGQHIFSHNVKGGYIQVFEVVLYIRTVKVNIKIIFYFGD